MEKTRYVFNDCHSHLVDFLQESEGIQALLHQMNQSGVQHSMINGLMVTKKWEEISPDKPTYYLDDDAECYWYSASDMIVALELQKLSPEDRNRFHPAICGFNPTDRNAIDHIRRMVAYFPGLWEGIGEIMTRHDDMTALTHGETARANHLALDPVYAFAAEHNWPVYLHSNISSVSSQNPIYLHEMEELLQKHPHTKIIWAHCGISRRIFVPDITKHLRRLLRSYLNLYLDLSWVIYDSYLVKEGKAVPEWIDLLSEFAERCMLGSDQTGHFAEYKESMQRYYLILDSLHPEVATKIAHSNFLNILPKKTS